ncbi:MAG: hypothetical protein KAJ39_09535 [Gammaproteobacteria bacterium]|nr:hypothetical protein [Gammaproteobacteria bacterium]
MALATAVIALTGYEEGGDGSPPLSTIVLRHQAPLGDGSDLMALIALWNAARVAILAVTVGQLIYYEAFGTRVDVAAPTTPSPNEQARTWLKWVYRANAQITSPAGGTKPFTVSIPCANGTASVMGNDGQMDAAFYDPLQIALDAFCKNSDGFDIVGVNAKNVGRSGKH